eukprot:TRINITY_DN11700_c0_g1_i1.p1 TRINITY_DN11700_c0_g1~~TRINITY_DN11700_c0_g1_i1.p1  ORF type:complete len:1302 (+),score=294.95 TRINITY_DN11700_c0_g1_i1:65-3970(+)
MQTSVCGPDGDPRFVDYGDHVEKLLTTLNAATSGVVAVVGPAGIGKTAFAAAVARSHAAAALYVDGILWFNVGPDVLLTKSQAQLASMLSDSFHEEFEDVATGMHYLINMFSGRRCLIVLDDVRMPTALEALACVDVSSGGRVLVTSREPSSTGVSSLSLYALPPPDSNFALQVLARHADVSTAEVSGELLESMQAVMHLCACVPLALALVGGAMPRPSSIEQWQNVRDSMQTALTTMMTITSDIIVAACLSAVQVAIAALSEVNRQRFQQLAIFEPGVRLSRNTVHNLWLANEMDKTASNALLIDLVTRALLCTDNSETTLYVHEPVHVAMRIEVDPSDLAQTHAKLVEGYARQCAGDWPALADDGYVHGHIAKHMIAANLQPVLTSQLLLDIGWLEAKLRACGLSELLNDFQLVQGDEASDLISRALRMSSATLRCHPEQLRAQLIARLAGRALSRECSRLLKSATLSPARYWLRPSGGCLPGPLSAELATLRGHVGPVTCVAVSSDGLKVLSGSMDATLRLWDVAQRMVLHVLRGHREAIRAAAMSGNATRAISGSVDSSLVVWDLQAGVMLHSLELHTEPVTCVVMTLDGKYAVSGSADRTIQLIDIERGVRLRQLRAHEDIVTAVAINYDATICITAGADQHVKVWEVLRGVEVCELHGHVATVIAAAVGGDGRFAITASDDGSVLVWNMRTSECFAACTASIFACAMSADSSLALTGSPSDHAVQMWAVETAQRTSSLCGHAGWVRTVALSSDGHVAVSGAEDYSVKVWTLDSSSRTSPPDLRHEAAVTHVAVSATGHRAFTVAADHIMKVWNVHESEEQLTLRGHSATIRAVSMTSDGGQALTGGDDRVLIHWDLERGLQLHALQGHDDGITALAICDASPLAVSGDASGAVIVWDTFAGRNMHVLKEHVGAVRVVTISADGSRVVTGGDDMLLRVWVPTQGKRAQLLRGHTGAITTAALSPDGKVCLSGSLDNNVRMWDTVRGVAVHILSAHSAPVRHIALAMKRQVAVSSGDDSAVYVWDLEHGTQLRQPITVAPSPIAAAQPADAASPTATTRAVLPVEALAAPPLVLRGKLIGLSADGTFLCTAAAQTVTLTNLVRFGDTMHFTGDSAVSAGAVRHVPGALVIGDASGAVQILLARVDGRDGAVKRMNSLVMSPKAMPLDKANVTVEKPIVEGSGLGAFVHYNVCALRFNQRVHVRRRYRDFYALHEELMHLPDAHPLPSFPPKVLIGRIGDEVNETRRAMLQTYMQHMCTSLPTNESLRRFIYHGATAVHDDDRDDVFMSPSKQGCAMM